MADHYLQLESGLWTTHLRTASKGADEEGAGATILSAASNGAATLHPPTERVSVRSSTSAGRESITSADDDFSVTMKALVKAMSDDGVDSRMSVLPDPRLSIESSTEEEQTPSASDAHKQHFTEMFESLAATSSHGIVTEYSGAVAQSTC